MFDKAIVIE